VKHNISVIKEPAAQTQTGGKLLISVIEAVRELIQNQDFAAEIKSKIGKEIDTST
jgi:hypothetical protein